MLPDQFIKDISENQLLAFYGWWQLSVCLFAFIALVAIWWHIGKKQQDFGQVWLAFSILCWSFSGFSEVYYAYQFRQQAAPIIQEVTTNSASWEQMQSSLQQLQEFQIQKNYQLNGWRSICSLFNSLFILLALPWFRYIPERISAVIKSNYWQIIIGLPFLFSLVPTIRKMILRRPDLLVSELDVYYAFLTLIFLGLVLWESFAQRRLKLLSRLSLICILITLTAQCLKLAGSDVDLITFSAIFKTSLIMLFFALALSWVKELAENTIPPPQQLFLRLEQQKTDNGRILHLAYLGGIPGKDNQPVALTPTVFKLLQLFIEYKLRPGEDWLEIKPKNEKRPSRHYEINDHNEIKRLVVALLDGLFGKGSWTKNQHEIPLKEALFESSPNRERRIRLRLPKENLN